MLNDNNMSGKVVVVWSMDNNFLFVFFFFKQKTAYEIGTGDWSSDVCSSDLATRNGQYKKLGAAATRNGQYKKRGAAATRNGQYKKRGRCRSENL